MLRTNYLLRIHSFHFVSALDDVSLSHPSATCRSSLSHFKPSRSLCLFLTASFSYILTPILSPTASPVLPLSAFPSTRFVFRLYFGCHLPAMSPHRYRRVSLPPPPIGRASSLSWLPVAQPSLFWLGKKRIIANDYPHCRLMTTATTKETSPS